MLNRIKTLFRCLVLLPALGLVPGLAHARIDGITGTTFNLSTGKAYLSTPDGGSVLVWGYRNGASPVQYPGPTLIVNVGDTVTVNLTNTLPQPVSIVFPGQEGVVATGGVDGVLAKEAAANNGTVSYTFKATQPGTYMYHSGTREDLQIEMGLFGALIVRPSTAGQAYNHPNTAYDREYLFLLSSMDQRIHDAVDLGETPDTADFHAVWWFINGRNGPDTIADANVPWMPNQPYSALAQAHPGEKVLLRVIDAGRQMHPFHTHGNNFLLIARDGRMLESTAGAGPDLAISNFTLQTVPGATYDALFSWTGAGLGWDIYNHKASDPLVAGEDPASHGKPIPVTLPSTQQTTPGGYFSGSPYLGTLGALPPGEGGLNPSAGYFYMWHSHTERELVNNDIFPGGMMTMFIVQPAGVSIP